MASSQLTSIDHSNEVALVGRLAAPAHQRVLPSGDVLGQFRLVVVRPAGGSGRSRVDTIDCTCWIARLRRQVERWGDGDLVEVSGALRRRFWRSAGGAPASRYDVEVAAARRLRRATMAG
jgi:single-strand DNA-binding protein